MKRILVLTGSPHPGGWSHRLADEFVKGAEEGGHEVFRFDAGLQPQGAVHFLQLEEHERTIIDNDVIRQEILPKADRGRHHRVCRFSLLFRHERPTQGSD